MPHGIHRKSMKSVPEEMKGYVMPSFYSIQKGEREKEKREPTII